MTRILAIGECMVELAPAVAANTYKVGFAGDTMNTAWYLRRLLGDHAADDRRQLFGSGHPVAGAGKFAVPPATASS